MTRLEAAKIAARAVALYLIVTCMMEMLSTMQVAANMIRLMQFTSSSPAGHTAVGIGSPMGTLLLVSLLRMGVTLLAALWIYRFGPSLQSFFEVKPLGDGEA